MNNVFVNDPYLVEIENALPIELCQALVDKYDYTVDQQRSKVDSLSICYKDGQKLCKACNCMRLNLMEHQIFKDEVYQVAVTTNELFKKYVQITESYSLQFPNKYNFESIKMKRYLPNTDQQFKLHIDAESWEMSKRFLAIIFYLNDDFDRGETVFVKHNKQIKPKRGKCVIFPPYWPWIHKAEPVTGQNAKYFMGTYLTHLE